MRRRDLLKGLLGLLLLRPKFDRRPEVGSPPPPEKIVPDSSISVKYADLPEALEAFNGLQAYIDQVNDATYPMYVVDGGHIKRLEPTRWTKQAIEATDGPSWFDSKEINREMIG